MQSLAFETKTVELVARTVIRRNEISSSFRELSMNYIKDNRSSVPRAWEQLPLLPEEEMAHYLHDELGYGFYLTRNGQGKIKQQSFKIPESRFWLDSTNPHFDTWVSQAVYNSPRSRRIMNVKTIALSFLDVDYYRSDATGWSEGKDIEQIAQAFIALCDIESIPRPSLIVHSGRGIQPKWIYNDPIPRQALPRWNAIEHQLVSKFEKYGADPNAKDAARVLRVPETLNTKADRYCHVIYENKLHDGSLLKYDFEYLCECLLPFTREQVKHRKNNYNNDKNQRSLALGRDLTLATLNWNRLEDFRTLLRLRGNIDEGMRMSFLFYCMNFMALSHQIDPKNFYLEAAEIAKEIDPHWNYRSNELKTVYAKLLEYRAGKTVTFAGREYPALYTPTNQTLIDLFVITPEEQEHLKTVIGSSEKQERKTQKRRQNGVKPRAEYEAHAAARKERAIELRRSGLSIRQIAKEMSLSVGSISGYLKGCSKCGL